MFLENGTRKRKNSSRKESAIVIEMIKSFGTVGTELTMTAFNRSAKLKPSRRGRG